MSEFTDQELRHLDSLRWERYVGLVRQLFTTPDVVPTDAQLDEMAKAVLLASEQGATPHIDRGVLRLGGEEL